MRIGAFDSGLAGLRRAEVQLDRAARELATPSERVSFGATEAAVVEQIHGSLAFRANVRVIQSAASMSDDLLRLVTANAPPHD